MISRQILLAPSHTTIVDGEDFKLVAGRRWNARHPDYAREYARKWRIENKAKVLERAATYRKCHRQRLREAQRRYRESVKGRAVRQRYYEERYREIAIRKATEWRIKNRERWLELHRAQESRRRARLRGRHTTWGC